MASATITSSSSNPILNLTARLPEWKLNYQQISGEIEPVASTDNPGYDQTILWNVQPLSQSSTDVGFFVINFYPTLQFNVPNLSSNSITNQFAKTINTFFNESYTNISLASFVLDYQTFFCFAYFEISNIDVSLGNVTLTISYNYAPTSGVNPNLPPQAPSNTTFLPSASLQFSFSGSTSISNNKSVTASISGGDGNFYYPYYTTSPFALNSGIFASDTVGTLTGYLTQPLNTLGENAIIYIVIVLSPAPSPLSSTCYPIFAYQPIFSEILFTNDGSTAAASAVINNGIFQEFSSTGFVSLNAIVQQYSSLGDVVGIFPITTEINTQGSFASGDDTFTLAWVQIASTFQKSN